MNDNELMLLTMYGENDLTITKALFRIANKYKTSWMHPRSKQWHLIDYVIVGRMDIRDVLYLEFVKKIYKEKNHCVRWEPYTRLRFFKISRKLVQENITSSLVSWDMR